MVRVILPSSYSIRSYGVAPGIAARSSFTQIKQYHKLGKALRTETTINHTTDFGLGKPLTNLPALQRIGYTANRRLPGAQRPSHDPSPAPTSCTPPAIPSSATMEPASRPAPDRPPRPGAPAHPPRIPPAEDVPAFVELESGGPRPWPARW
jgi:hypothetical protein